MINHSLLFLFSYPVMSDSLCPCGLQHTRSPCPSPSPRVCSNSYLLSPWCLPTISSSVALFSSFPQSFPVSGSFQMSQFFASGGQSIGVSASPSVLPMNIQGWFPSGLISFRFDLNHSFDWFDLLSVQGTLKSLLQHHSSKISILRLVLSFLYIPTQTFIHDCWKNHSFE